MHALHIFMACYLKFFFFGLFIILCVEFCLHVCLYTMSVLDGHEGQKRHKILWRCSYWYLWANMWVLRTNPGSCTGATNALPLNKFSSPCHISSKHVKTILIIKCMLRKHHEFPPSNFFESLVSRVMIRNRCLIKSYWMNNPFY